MDNNIICHECGIENEPQYAYCKNCGTALKAEEPKQKQQGGAAYQYQQATTNTYNTYNPQNVVLEYIDGIPTEDIVTFVGKKAHNICPKFTKMELTASKATWCWPVAVLSYIFGPLGAAIWFFYRKMYKIALILAAIGVIAGVGAAFIQGPTVDYNALLDAYSGDSYGGFFTAFEEALKSQDTLRTEAANAVDFLVRVSTMIVTGIFGFYWYKRYVSVSINRYRTMGVDPRYYRMGLASVGGTSSGMAVLGVGIMFLAQELFSLITMLM